MVQRLVVQLKLRRTRRAKEAGNARKNPQMITMLLPWITFWTATSFDSQVGAMIVLLVTALMPLIMRNFKFTIWDRISFALVGALSAGVFMSGNGDSNLIVNLGYLAFGLMWLASCLTKDLSALHMLSTATAEIMPTTIRCS